MSRWDPGAQGRLADAALELFAEQGFDRTTVAGIAARAGLTERTFFRHYADKREVLFAGDRLAHHIAARLAEVPSGVTPLEAVTVVMEDASEVTTARADWARQRAEIVAAHPELRERELAKMGMLATVMAEGLRERGVSAAPAQLTAEIAVLAFRLAYERWAAGPPSVPAASLVRVLLAELRDAVTSTCPSPTAPTPP
ncbi:TetR family transcriptional regulator [Auraticoccus monumenti]|uniref:DNA-binding transcriptional regulator, AcrR family n=1 Tax=Auraticoccus monumenti TaxID=675864 RepID=A0A1G7CAW4_9ACTN|nr:TetR family transcriptional regulator [Auraticoccus monumenti]SDE36459.1 DNA-binding transcriptional regulator, AcrR family [Auraticoccus monumenti]